MRGGGADVFGDWVGTGREATTYGGVRNVTACIVSPAKAQLAVMVLLLLLLLHVMY